jgi:hypothetical protein
MVVRCALIQNNQVINVIMADPAEYQPEGFEVVASDTANINDSYADGVFTPSESEE